ncbi:MAG: hypothetical protein MPJ25_14725, partial [Pirellulales bacterium]|nr:hypothetical protein [Pirellulales bacterium]
GDVYKRQVNAQLLGLQEMLDSLEEVQPTDPQAVSKVSNDAEERETAKTKVAKTEIASAPSVKKIDGKAGSKSSTTKSTRAKAAGGHVDRKGSEGVNQSDEVPVEKIKANEKKSTDSVVTNESEKPAGTQKKKESEKK